MSHLLFSRVLTVTGSPRRALPWALGVTSYVNDHSDLDVTLWSGTFCGRLTATKDLFIPRVWPHRAGHTPRLRTR